MMETVYVLSVFLVTVTTSAVPERESVPLATTTDTQMLRSKYTTTQSKVIFFFYSRNSLYEIFEVQVETITLLRYSNFNADKPTLFIVHGWRTSDATSPWLFHIKQKIFYHNDINVFAVDWSAFAGKNYLTAQRSVVKVGELVADFITTLVKVFEVNLRSISLVGHSLGAHICGNAGAALRGNIEIITGLDPAGLFFTVKNIHNRLDPTDGKFVQVIHTSDAKLGFNERLGHADYYPNGGRYQPGCGRDLTGKCAHTRAYIYYVESLIDNNFIARRCSSYANYLLGKCNFADGSFLGSYPIDTRARGTYYLRTNEEYPYARGYYI